MATNLTDNSLSDILNTGTTNFTDLLDDTKLNYIINDNSRQSEISRLEEENKKYKLQLQSTNNSNNFVESEDGTLSGIYRHGI